MNTFITIGEKKCVERREKASRQTTEFQERRENAGNLRGIYCFWNCPLFRLQMKKRVAYIMEAVSLKKKKKKKSCPNLSKVLLVNPIFPLGNQCTFTASSFDCWGRWLRRQFLSHFHWLCLIGEQVRNGVGTSQLSLQALLWLANTLIVNVKQIGLRFGKKFAPIQST